MFVFNSNNKEMKILIFGSKGMLGNYVKSYLSKKYKNVKEINRDAVDASNTSFEHIESGFIYEGMGEGDVVINCMGTIKPRVDELGPLNALQVNSVFPRLLGNVCEKYGVKLLHPTTDCVFTGNKGRYTEEDLHDVTDIYGRTKSLGEPENCTVIRTSIIGEEKGQSRSLVEWIKSEKGNTVNGYTNHMWNGVTCLQFARICEEIISKNLFWEGVRHVYSPTAFNKKDLVECISEEYELNITVNALQTDVSCDRTLSTIHKTMVTVPELSQQILEMKNFILDESYSESNIR